jgi:hypothetical protein
LVKNAKGSLKFWQALGGGAIAWALMACGSAFRAGPDASTDAAEAATPPDGPTDAAATDAAREADVATEGSADAALCSEVPSSAGLCRGYLQYENACGFYKPCDCKYWEDNCTKLTADTNVSFEGALLACALGNELAKKNGCTGVTTVEECAYASYVKSPGLTADQQTLLEAYCLMCDPSSTDCMSGVYPFVGEYTNPVTNKITTNCTGPAANCAAFGACVQHTLGLSDPCADGGT